MRNAFIDELVCLAEIYPQIALIVGDLGFSVIEPFADRFPDRFLNAGICEQNMTGMAAGMASEGYHVFTYSIANFPTFRCAEQIRNDVDYHKLPVTVVSVGGGLAYGALGYSHHAVQDYALMRSLPNMLIASPGDPAEVRAVMRYIVENPGPSYLRLGKAGEPVMHACIPAVSPGTWLTIKSGDDPSRAILSTGAALQQGVGLLTQAEFNQVSLFSMPLWSMASKSLQPQQIEAFEQVISIEDHLVDGGFGSWLLEAASSARLANRIVLRALDSRVCGTVGSQATLNRLGGIA